MKYGLMCSICNICYTRTSLVKFRPLLTDIRRPGRGSEVQSYKWRGWAQWGGGEQSVSQWVKNDVIEPRGGCWGWAGLGWGWGALGIPRQYLAALKQPDMQTGSRRNGHNWCSQLRSYAGGRRSVINIWTISVIFRGQDFYLL